MSTFTPEQAAATERRYGNLLLDASAGSGKTTVLVERFVRAVLDDGLDSAQILAITFTEKAAAELRERIGRRLRDAAPPAVARAGDGGSVSTIHGFCARLLRAHALAAGLDPRFAVLDALAARRLADRAFADALEEVAAADPAARAPIGAYGPSDLREAVLAVYGELRARGERRPGLPATPPAPALEEPRTRLQAAAGAVAAELGGVDAPAARVREALSRLERCDAVLGAGEPWPGALEELALPRNGGTVLDSEACAAYRDALEGFRAACAHRRATGVASFLDALLRAFGRHYEGLKAARGAVDFEDLELGARDLLAASPELRERLRERYALVMVDELQDTNAVQLELIDAVCADNLFTVGDAQQAIYGFRHADVELFERLGERRARQRERLSLNVNFRSRPELIDAFNRAFAGVLGDRFRPLVAGRSDRSEGEPAVELLVADKAGEWAGDGIAAGWRLAEARALAGRVAELLAGGIAARQVVVLTRATTDLRAYERALEQAGVPTYVIGGRGYWEHPQVIDVVALLRALANPLDEEALLTVLTSPMAGLSLDALVILAGAAQAAESQLWPTLGLPADGLAAEDRRRLERFLGWFGRVRAEVPRRGIHELIELGIEASGYDLAVLALAGGQRRLANVRKLMRLGREYEAAEGADLRGFVDTIGGQGGEELGGGGDPRESEAPVEGEALDAVRLMTIHRAKGLEFDIVCVADLGRGPVRRAQLLRVGRDGGLGIALAGPGGGRRQPALELEALAAEARAREEAEERRLFYVAATRARERLILSGAARYEAWEKSSGPITWLGPAFAADVATLLGDGGGISEAGVRVTAVLPDADTAPADEDRGPAPAVIAAAAPLAAAAPEPVRPPSPPPAAPTLSYTALSELRRCGYRFYLERVLGLLPAGPGTSAASQAATRGTVAHRLLERLDFRRPVPAQAGSVPGCDALDATQRDAVDALVAAFAGSPLCRRLAGARRATREQRFAFTLGGLTITGVFDVLAEEAPGRLLVVDYKTDHLAEGESPARLAASRYGIQRTIYALAALRTGAGEVEVIHAFLEDIEAPALATYSSAAIAELEAELAHLCEPARSGRYRVTDVPERRVCAGCPGEGGLCSWPVAMTRRAGVDQLF